MKYHIKWTKRAIQELADIWLKSTNRNAVTAASAKLDTQLSRAPLSMGGPRSSSVHRVALCEPLGIEYYVVEDDKKVIVRGAWAVS